MGAATKALLPGGKGAYTWKLQNRKETVIPATSFRVLRRAKK